MADPGANIGGGKRASGTAQGTSKKWDKNADGIPDVLEDADKRRTLLRKYGYTEADLKNKAARDLFYEAVRKEYTKKEAKEARDEVYVNDTSSVRDIVDESGFTMELIRASRTARCLPQALGHAGTRQGHGREPVRQVP